MDAVGLIHPRGRIGLDPIPWLVWILSCVRLSRCGFVYRD